MSNEENIYRASGSRVMKNTVFLFFRMLLVLGVNLYTVRVVFGALGQEDYGIYNALASFLIAFSFINTLLLTTNQRFLSYKLGLGDHKGVKDVFSAVLTLYIIFDLFFITLGLCGSHFFIYHFLNIPKARLDVALSVFCLSLGAFVFKSTQICFNAVVIAHEQMSFFAFLGILESVLNLLCALIISKVSCDRLLLYAVILLVNSVLIFTFYVSYCFIKFPQCCRYSIYFPRRLFKELGTYLGWSCLGGIANVLKKQGLAILLNCYFGVVVNGALAIAFQVSGGLLTFVGSFQAAMNPQIIKTYASNQLEDYYRLIFSTSRISFFLMWFAALPFYLYAPQITKLWLGETNSYIVVFAILTVAFVLIDAISGSFASAAYALNDVKKYHLIVSSVMLSTLPFCWLAIKCGMSPYGVLGVNVLVNLFVHITRVIFLSYAVKLSIKRCFRESILPILLVFIFSVIGILPFVPNISPWDSFENIGRSILIILWSIILNAVVIFIFGFTSHERNKILLEIRRLTLGISGNIFSKRNSQSNSAPNDLSR